MIQEQYSQEEDTLFWKRFLSGDDGAYAYFYRKYVMVLFSYGMRFTSDRELVKDCIQDVFVKLYSGRSNLKQVKQVRVYLFVSLKNALYTVFHKGKTVYYIDEMEPVFNLDYTAEEQMIAKEEEKDDIKKLRAILNTLTPRQKEVIYYRYIQGMELRDICQLMNINYQSLQNLISRSVQKVKKTFEETNNAVRHVGKHMSIAKQG